jgi:hypothetical protein
VQAPPAQPTSAQNRTHCRGELLGRRSPARSRTASATPPSQKPGLLAPQRKRSSAQPDPVYEANTEDTVRYGLCAFWHTLFVRTSPVFPSVRARSARVGTGKRKSGRDKGCQQLVVRGLLRSPTGKLDIRVASR